MSNMDSINRDHMDKANEDNSNHHGAEIINKVLRGELAAIEAYEKVLEKFAGDPIVNNIIDLKLSHQATVRSLQERVIVSGDLPAESPGAWGTFVSTVVSTASALGDTLTLTAMIEGEEHGLTQYENLAGSEDLSMIDKNLIVHELIPRQKQNILSLKSMLSN